MHRIAILVIHITEGGGITAIKNIIQILNPITEELLLIGSVEKEGNNPFEDVDINKSLITHKSGGWKLKRIFNIIYTQIRMSLVLLRWINRIDSVYFVGDFLLLPSIISKIFKKNMIIALLSSSVQVNQAVDDNFHREIRLISELNYKLSDNILLYSPSLISEWSLEKYESKIRIIRDHFLDFTEFKVKKELNERENIVGYIGRLSSEKGVMELLQAIPIILNRREDTTFIIGGTGPLENEIRTKLKQNNLSKQVKLTGWIPDDEFVDYLNKLKLLVIPSETEGLPYIILESMACGTPVLATNVGSISDFITDGVNGFIMDDNSVESLTYNINRVLEFSNLEDISQEALSFVEKNFNYETAVGNYKSLLDKFQ